MQIIEFNTYEITNNKYRAQPAPAEVGTELASDAVG